MSVGEPPSEHKGAGDQRGISRFAHAARVTLSACRPLVRSPPQGLSLPPCSPRAPPSSRVRRPTTLRRNEPVRRARTRTSVIPESIAARSEATCNASRGYRTAIARTFATRTTIAAQRKASAARGFVRCVRPSSRPGSGCAFCPARTPTWPPRTPGRRTRRPTAKPTRRAPSVAARAAADRKTAKSASPDRRPRPRAQRAPMRRRTTLIVSSMIERSKSTE